MTTSSRWDRIVRVLDWVLRIVGVAGFLVAWFALQEIGSKAECQGRVNQQITTRAQNLNEEINEERTAERRADDALTNVVTAVTARPPVPQAEWQRRFSA